MKGECIIKKCNECLNTAQNILELNKKIEFSSAVAFEMTSVKMKKHTCKSSHIPRLYVCDFKERSPSSLSHFQSSGSKMSGA